MEQFLQYFLLFIIIIALSSQDYFIKRFNEADARHSNFDTNLRFLTISAGFEFIVLVVVWLVAGKDDFFHLPTLGYSVIFGVCFVCATLFTMLAIVEGSLALSTLLISYSLLLPTAWSIFFNGDEQYKSPLFIIGIILLCVSIFLIRDEDTGEKKKVTKKWVFYVVGAFFSNGVCNIVMDVHQQYYPGQYRSPFLAMAMVVVEAVCLLIILIRRNARVRFKRKPLVVCSTLNGCANATANLLVMTVIGAGVIPASVMFPVMSAGQFIFVFVISFVIFRERFSKLQYLGYFLGALSVVLLNMA